MEPEGQVDANFIDCCNVPPTPTPTPTCVCVSYRLSVPQSTGNAKWVDCSTGIINNTTIVKDNPIDICTSDLQSVTDNVQVEFIDCCTESTPTPTPTITPTPTPTCDCLLIRFENFTVNEGQVTYRDCFTGFVGSSPVPPGGNLSICTNELVDYDVFLEGPNIIGTCCDA
jgi:hypothetical protein